MAWRMCPRSSHRIPASQGQEGGGSKKQHVKLSTQAAQIHAHAYTERHVCTETRVRTQRHAHTHANVDIHTYKQTDPMHTPPFRARVGQWSMVCQGRGNFFSPRAPQRSRRPDQPRFPHPFRGECVYTGQGRCPEPNRFASIRVKTKLSPSPVQRENKEAQIREGPAQGPSAKLHGAGTGTRDFWLWSSSGSAAPLQESASGVIMGTGQIAGPGALPCFSLH